VSEVESLARTSPARWRPRPERFDRDRGHTAGSSARMRGRPWST